MRITKVMKQNYSDKYFKIPLRSFRTAMLFAFIAVLPFFSIAQDVKDNVFKDLLYTIYPNPVKKGQDFNVKLENLQTFDNYVMVYDLTGNVVLKETVLQTSDIVIRSISTDKLHAGIYLVSIQHKRYTSIVKKLVINE